MTITNFYGKFNVWFIIWMAANTCVKTYILQMFCLTDRQPVKLRYIST